MRRSCLPGLLLTVAACLTAHAAVWQRIQVESDGSVRGQFRFGNEPEKSAIFRFGLPTNQAERQWEENGVLRGLWVKNGVKYLQTVLVSEAFAEAGAASGLTGQHIRASKVLLVNIEGENTDREYAEAFAELAVEIEGKRQPLELKEGFVWCGRGEFRRLLGALDIPESGIKVSGGDTLKFQGNMPPSLKGSMTLKIPLAPLTGTAKPDWLLDFEIDAALRRALSPSNASSANTNQVRVVFAGEEQGNSGGR